MIRAELNQEILRGGQRVSRARLEQVLKLVHRACKGDWLVSIAFVDSKTMKRLNKSYRGKNTLTDVLSFPLQEDGVLGELVLSYEQAKRQADRMRHPVQDEIVFLLVHGILHLYGYDHEKPQDAKKMFPLQTRILQQLGINPDLC